MATLSSIAARVVRGTGILAPSTIAGSSDETAQRLLEAAQVCGEVMSRRHEWIALMREESFDTVDGTANYDLPADFDRILSDTAWHQDAYWMLRGNLGAAEWQWRQNAVAALPATRKAFRIKFSVNTKKLSLHPTPAAVEPIVYEYISNGWCRSAAGELQSAWVVDTDVLMLDESLFVLGTRWLFKQSSGLPYVDDRSLWEEQMDLVMAQEVAPPSVDFGAMRSDLRAPNVQDGNYG